MKPYSDRKMLITNIIELGKLNKTDKVQHNYLSLYGKYLGHLKNEPIILMEIGVNKGGSLRTWEQFFTSGQIIGVDNCTMLTSEELQKMSQGRIKTFLADQSNREQLAEVAKEIGSLDAIIDDGSHDQNHQQISLGFLFPFLKPGGLYVIEDLTPQSYPRGGWGIQDMKNFSDVTTNVLEEFKSTGKMVSPYMTPKEMDFLSAEIDRVEIHYISESSIIAFIWRKP